MIQPGMLVLFQGDSITDADRGAAPDSADLLGLGAGYAAMVAALARARHPELGLRFLNRGVAGDRVRDVRARWSVDCLDLEPDLVSLLVGVNDTWRTIEDAEVTSQEEFRRDYAFLTDAALQQGARLVLCTPFCLPVGEVTEAWRADLEPRIEVVRAIAAQTESVLVDFDALFLAATRNASAEHWTADGVHPTPAGHALMAQEWLRRVLP